MENNFNNRIITLEDRILLNSVLFVEEREKLEAANKNVDKQRKKVENCEGGRNFLALLSEMEETINSKKINTEDYLERKGAVSEILSSVINKTLIKDDTENINGFLRVTNNAVYLIDLECYNDTEFKSDFLPIARINLKDEDSGVRVTPDFRLKKLLKESGYLEKTEDLSKLTLEQIYLIKHLGELISQGKAIENVMSMMKEEIEELDREKKDMCFNMYATAGYQRKQNVNTKND